MYLDINVQSLIVLVWNSCGPQGGGCIIKERPKLVSYIRCHNVLGQDWLFWIPCSIDMTHWTIILSKYLRKERKNSVPYRSKQLCYRHRHIETSKLGWNQLVLLFFHVCYNQYWPLISFHSFDKIYIEKIKKVKVFLKNQFKVFQDLKKKKIHE